MSAQPLLSEKGQLSLQEVIKAIKVPAPDYSMNTLYANPIYNALFNVNMETRLNAICELCESNKELKREMETVFERKSPQEKAEFLKYLTEQLINNSESIKKADELAAKFQTANHAFKKYEEFPDMLNNFIRTQLTKEEIDAFKTNKKFEELMNKFIKDHPDKITPDVQEKLKSSGFKFEAPGNPLPQQSQESSEFTDLKERLKQKGAKEDFTPTEIKAFIINYDDDPTKILANESEREKLKELAEGKPNFLAALSALDHYHTTKPSPGPEAAETLKATLNRIFLGGLKKPISDNLQAGIDAMRARMKDPDGTGQAARLAKLEARLEENRQNTILNAPPKSFLPGMERARLTANAPLPTKLSSAATADQQNPSLLELRKLLQDSSDKNNAGWKIPEPKPGADRLQIFKNNEPFGTAKIDGQNIKYEFNKTMEPKDAQAILEASQHIEITSSSMQDIYSLTTAAAAFKPPKSVTLNESTQRFLEAAKSKPENAEMIAKIEANMAAIENAHPKVQQKSEGPKIR